MPFRLAQVDTEKPVTPYGFSEEAKVQVLGHKELSMGERAVFLTLLDEKYYLLSESGSGGLPRGGRGAKGR
ncbi:MAG: hypothetical protein XD60_1818 [Acetothermia bacterium 64_32]|nr:MAG: hypothetical protein XD60_1818 [Acetothermia bacterium 64_32]HAF69938.1 hypothetical protein [Candidatus Acetothermia bacterium]